MEYTTMTHTEGDKMKRDHNRRKHYKNHTPQNIHPDRPHETVVDKDIASVYEEIFEEVIKEYNAKQIRNRHPDKVIPDAKAYYKSLKKDDIQHAVYEQLVYIGNKNNHPDYETSKKILKAYLEAFQEKFPNLKVIGFYIHGDEEGATHAHLDFIPVSYEGKKGLSTKVSFHGALKEMKIKPKKLPDGSKSNPVAMWEASCLQTLDDLCAKYGICVKEHTHKPKEERRGWQTTEEYVKQKLQAEVQEIKEEKNKLVDKTTSRNATVHKIPLTNKEYITRDLDEDLALLSEVNEAQTIKANQSKRDKEFKAKEDAFHREKAAFNHQKATLQWEFEGKYKEKAEKADTWKKAFMKTLNKMPAGSLSEVLVSDLGITPDKYLKKKLEALDKLDAFYHKCVPDDPYKFRKVIITEYKKIIDNPEDRSFWHDDITWLWADCKKNINSYYQAKRDKKELDKIIREGKTTVIQAFKSYNQLIQEAQKQYEDHER
ncbi:plasmid recombination protein [Butyrivibrio sp. XPD2006]|uniref:plasmid recombination protein n=1 Tax=Butyrivibrio sp. XPD2006 TaxID=1280668 RepID=UPI0003B37F1E|nr:plasmid recombination protein [Butyrivibrio sp. XPD2006]